MRLARTPFWACGHWSAFARYGRLINRPSLAAPPETVSAQADTWREAPEESDFNRLNSYRVSTNLNHSDRAMLHTFVVKMLSADKS